MKQYVLLRGHEGSGKSTFAAQYMAWFRRVYPHAYVLCLDNDEALYDENGQYHFDFPTFQAAHQANMQRQQNTWAMGLAEPHRDILLINANPNQKTKTCLKWLQQAQQHGFETVVYRLHNFFSNAHGVAEHEVWQSYARLNANPVAGEKHLTPVQAMTAAQRAQCQAQGMMVDFDFCDFQAA